MQKTSGSAVSEVFLRIFFKNPGMRGKIGSKQRVHGVQYD